jgi:hypothetical protein
VANEEHVIEVIHVRIVMRRKLEATGRLGDGRAVRAGGGELGADGGFDRDSPRLSPQRRSLRSFFGNMRPMYVTDAPRHVITEKYFNQSLFFAREIHRRCRFISWEQPLYRR